jgi:hypothetical protein
MIRQRSIHPNNLAAPPSLNRREFVSYSFLLVCFLLILALMAAFVWSVTPQREILEASRLADFPRHNWPYPISEGELNLYLVNTGSGLIALDRHHPHPTWRCLVEWVPMTGRIEDPCSGSKFTPTGDFILGLATRNMDRYPVKSEHGQVLIETSRLILGKPQAEFIICLDRYNEPGKHCYRGEVPSKLD